MLDAFLRFLDQVLYRHFWYMYLVGSAHFLDGIDILHLLVRSLVLSLYIYVSGLIASVSEDSLNEGIFGFAGST